ncbi:3'(2'),5'-bisphosphate nucleotidase CysQ [Kaistia granuli]|uniref:3'(2'),5'-bisphosphate nucleotidase CysQ n=1 Tax=Kaistia granuli TaxID=363259 RepID=UPI0003A7E090|nr:3'(2'),5'-bisphosphate nucleotidase CysQ [Kaistia granuli]
MSRQKTPDDAVFEALIATAIAAGVVVMRVYDGGFAVEHKGDASPVTEADRLAEQVILADLARLVPGIPVVAEEACADGLIPAVGATFFLVDPVDGTREFISRNGDFTVNIGLVENGEPTLGIVYAPARGDLYAGRLGKGAEHLTIVDGAIAHRRAIHVADPAASPPRILASRSHRTPETDEFIARFPGASLVVAGSSLKFCLMAAGEADLYPRMGPTMQWDTAAGDAVLRAAGGMVETIDGETFVYGPGAGDGVRAFANPWFVARGAERVAAIA